MALKLNYICTPCAQRTPYSVHNILRKFEQISWTLFTNIIHIIIFSFKLRWEKAKFRVTITPKCPSSCPSSIFSWVLANFLTYFVVATIPKIVTFNCQENRILNYWKLKIMMMMMIFWARSIGHKQWVTLWFIIFHRYIFKNTFQDVWTWTR